MISDRQHLSNIVALCKNNTAPIATGVWSLVEVIKARTFGRGSQTVVLRAAAVVHLGWSEAKSARASVAALQAALF